MTEEYKKGKVPEIVREFDNTGNKYEINGIDQSKCKFFWRKENEKFQIINSGSYRITQEGGTYYLLIEDDKILTNATQFQICYFFEQQSSAYVDKFPELSVAVRKINDLVEDVKNIFSYLKSTGVTGDTSTMSKVLSELEEQCVWWLNNGRIESLPITEMYSKFDRLVERLRKEILKLLEQDLEAAEKELLEEVKRQLDEYVETDLKQRLDDYTTQLEERLQTMIDQAVADKGLMPEGSDWLEIGLGNWLVVDLFNKNYIHYPPQLNSSDNAGVVKKDITDGGKSQVIRYYTTTGKMLFVVRVNEVWSEWQELGGQTDTMQFTQANHGFVFTAVTLDGATRKWVKANKYTSADGVAIKIDNDRFDVVTRGIVNIPTSARDDKGEPFVYDEYYFLSQEVDGGLSRTKNEIGTFQYLAHISEIDGKQVAYIDIGDSYDLDYEVVDTETADRVGIGTYKTTLRTADTIEDLKRLNLKAGDVVEVLGYYTKGDGADHKRKIESSDDGSGVQLANGLWANLIYDKEINISWIGCKPNDDSYALQNSNIINKFLSKEKTCVFIPNGTWHFQQIKFNSYCAIRGENRFNTILKQSLDIDNVGDEPNKNNAFIQSLDIDLNWIGRCNTTKYCKIENFNLIGKNQANIRGLSFGSFRGNLELGNVADSQSIISNLKIENFSDGLYIGYFYKEMRIENVHSLYNDNSGIIIVGTDNFINNCTAHHNKKNGIEILGGECRLEFSKSFWNENSGFYLTQECTVNNISAQENELHGIVIESSNQVYLLTNLFLGSNGMTPEGIGQIKDNSSAITIIGDYNKLNIVSVSTDYRSEPEKNGYSYSRYFMNIIGKYNVISGILNSSIKFTKLFNLKNNLLKTFLVNGQDVSKEYLVNQYDLSKEMLLAHIFIEKDTTVRYTGIYGSLDIKSTNIGYKTEEYNGTYGFNFVIQFGNENGVVFSTRNVKMLDGLELKAYYKLITDNEVEVIITTKFTGGYFKYLFETSGYDASMWLNPEEYREEFNDDTYSDLIIRNDDPVVLNSLDTPYYTYKMEQEGGTTKQDFYTYLGEKFAYDKQLEAEQKAKYEAYQQALTNNPNLTYEEFIASYPMMLPNIEEPTIPQSVQEFMKKYL